MYMRIIMILFVSLLCTTVDNIQEILCASDTTLRSHSWWNSRRSSWFI